MVAPLMIFSVFPLQPNSLYSWVTSGEDASFAGKTGSSNGSYVCRLNGLTTWTWRLEKDVLEGEPTVPRATLPQDSPHPGRMNLDHAA